jgi:hypothetical protein
MRRTTEGRKFYVVREKIAVRRNGFELLNENQLFYANGRRVVFLRPIEPHGFENYLATPTFLCDPKRGRVHWDFQEYLGYWFISDRMKSILETIDPGAFAFLKCKVQKPDGGDGPSYWLCDVVRVLDALDEEKSAIKIRTASDGSKVYNMMANPRLFFKDDLIGSCRIFRMKFSEHRVICDSEMKLACKAASLIGLSFGDAA